MSAILTIRDMRESDLAAADRVFRLAFGTWFQVPDPMQFRGDAALFGPRLRANPDGGIVAEQDGAIVGLGFASHWGSIGILGPIAVLPHLWRQGVARQLIGPVLDVFARWRCPLAGLFTFPQSATHLRLYQEFGFLAAPFDAGDGEAGGRRSAGAGRRVGRDGARPRRRMPRAYRCGVSGAGSQPGNHDRDRERDRRRDRAHRRVEGRGLRHLPRRPRQRSGLEGLLREIRPGEAG